MASSRKIDYQQLGGLAKKYLDALDRSDPGIIELFEAEAEIVSPLYGTLRPNEFYPRLFTDSRTSTTTLYELIRDPQAGRLAFYFLYQWTLAGGQQVQFDCVDLANIGPGGKIRQLRIIYDTHLVRPYL